MFNKNMMAGALACQYQGGLEISQKMTELLT